MKSFRLDGPSIQEFLESLPTTMAALGLVGLVWMLDRSGSLARKVLLGTLAVWLVYVGRSTVTTQLRHRFPSAKSLGLLSAGMASLIVSVATFVIPILKYPVVSLSFLCLSFVAILSFVLINRRDPDVFH